VTDPNTPAPPPAPRGRSVLVVDDEPMIRRVVQLALCGEGHAVAEAENAAAAAEAVRAAGPPFDLVLLDLTLPDGDGRALIPLVRRHSPGTRVLVVSGLGESEASGVGGDGFLAKPFTKSSLLAAVGQALGGTA
jgi:two-component system OmpR family response regulator